MVENSDGSSSSSNNSGLNGEGPWAQAGEYRRPKAELEAAKAERRRYEEAAQQCDRYERQPPKKFGEAHEVWS